MCTDIPLAEANNMANCKISEAGTCSPLTLLGDTAKSHGKEYRYIISCWEGVKSLKQ